MRGGGREVTELRKNLSYEQIILAAVAEVVEVGYEALSLRRVAERLGVKPASLYNHIDGVADLRAGIAIHSAGGLESAILAAMDGRDREEAFLRGCLAYRDYATENSALYHALISARSLNEERVHRAGMRVFEPLISIVRSYGFSEVETTNFHRALRSSIHGFIELCNNGFMTQGPTSRDDSYLAMIEKYTQILIHYPGDRKENKQ